MGNPDAAGSEHDLAAERHRCERWFVRRGLPHLIHDYSASADVLTRAAPFLALVAAFIGLFSGLQFAVSVVLDSSYRSEFAEDMTEELREALAVRAVYHRTLVPDTP